MLSLAILLTSPALVMIAANRLVDFGRKWPPRIAVLFAAVAPVLAVLALSRQADAISSAAAVAISPVFLFYGLIVGGITYAVVKPR